MKIVRVTNAMGVEVLREKGILATLPGQTQDEMAGHLNEVLLQLGKLCYIPVAIQDDEIVAYIIAYVNSPNTVFMPCVWTKENDPSGDMVAKTLFQRVMIWAEAVGATKLLIEVPPERKPEAITRRWGFKLQCTVMQLEVNDENLQTLSEEITNGRRIRQQSQSEDRVDSDPRTEHNQQTDSGVSEQQGWTTHSGIQSGLDTGPAAGRLGADS